MGLQMFLDFFFNILVCNDFGALIVLTVISYTRKDDICCIFFHQ